MDDWPNSANDEKSACKGKKTPPTTPDGIVSQKSSVSDDECPSSDGRGMKNKAAAAAWPWMTPSDGVVEKGNGPDVDDSSDRADEKDGVTEAWQWPGCGLTMAWPSSSD